MVQGSFFKSQERDFSSRFRAVEICCCLPSNPLSSFFRSSRLLETENEVLSILFDNSQQSNLRLEEMGKHFEVGDWKLLYLLSKNMEPVVFGEFLRELYKSMSERHDRAAPAASSKSILV